jgi:5'-deoxynucleotidase YfbR-like HD superfamily hydrolase
VDHATVDLAAAWALLREQLDERLTHFQRELATVWRELEAVNHQVGEAFRTAESQVWTPGRLASLEEFFGGIGENLLLSPLRTRLRVKPQLRALAAMDDLLSAAEAIARRLPATLRASRKDLLLLETRPGASANAGCI